MCWIPVGPARIHFTKGFWTHKQSLVKISVVHISILVKWWSDQVTNSHMSRQVSCRDTHKFVAGFNLKNLDKAMRMFSRFQLLSQKIICQIIPWVWFVIQRAASFSLFCIMHELCNNFLYITLYRNIPWFSIYRSQSHKIYTRFCCVLLSLFHQFIVDSRDQFTILLRDVFH